MDFELVSIFRKNVLGVSVSNFDNWGTKMRARMWRCFSAWRKGDHSCLPIYIGTLQKVPIFHKKPIYFLAIWDFQLKLKSWAAVTKALRTSVSDFWVRPACSCTARSKADFRFSAQKKRRRTCFTQPKKPIHALFSAFRSLGRRDRADRRFFVARKIENPLLIAPCTNVQAELKNPRLGIRRAWYQLLKFSISAENLKSQESR